MAGDITAGSGTIELNGSHARVVRIGAGNLRMNGSTIHGDLTVNSANNLQMSNSNVEGTIRTAGQTLEIGHNSVVNKIHLADVESYPGGISGGNGVFGFGNAVATGGS